MFRHNHRGLGNIGFLLLAAALVTACDRDSPYDPVPGSGDVSLRADAADAGIVTVMTRNLFVGAPIEQIYAVEDPVQIPSKAAELWAWVGSTNFEERAEAIADEIARAQPHVIGLQEVSLFYIFRNFDLGDWSHDLVPSDELDFLTVLLGKLGERGLAYLPASYTQNFQGAVPMLDPTSDTYLSLIVLTDLDFILVKEGVTFANPQNANFDESLEVELGGTPLEILRGWASVDVTVEGLSFRFVTTHLETETDADVQIAQGNELIEILTDGSGDPLPTILTGDLNSDADGGDTPTVGYFFDAGFEDAWGTRGDGLTCCQDETLLERPSQLYRRPDVILMLGDFGLAEPGIRGAVHATIVGNKISDLTPSLRPLAVGPRRRLRRYPPAAAGCPQVSRRRSAMARPGEVPGDRVRRCGGRTSFELWVMEDFLPGSR